MGYSIDIISENCYPGTNVLINKFGIHEERKLSEIESVIATTQSAKWESNPQISTFNFSHYKMIHFFLFSELYDWAGKTRTVNISKKGTKFIAADKIEYQAILIFNRLEKKDYFKKLKFENFIEEIVDFYCATNFLHPFREGNGRTQRVFLTQLIRNAGYNISFADIDTELLMIATIQSAQGITDLLKQIFAENIVQE